MEEECVYRSEWSWDIHGGQGEVIKLKREQASLSLWHPLTSKNKTKSSVRVCVLTMLEGLEGEPEEDDWVKQAVQTMSPEDLQESGGGEEGKKREGREAWERWWPS